MIPPKPIIALGKFIWSTQWQIMMGSLAPTDQAGNYQRPRSQFRHGIGDGGDHNYCPDRDRYGLIVGMGCPWAHRTLVVRALKGLEEVISVTIAQPDPEGGSWLLPADHNLGVNSLPAFYRHHDPTFKGRATVPVLYDRQTHTIVNNESSDIIMMLNAQFNDWANRPDVDLYPEALRGEIDQWNDRIYRTVNNGVYRCGFAQSQTAYDQACNELFDTLDHINMVLAERRYLGGDRLTLADVRLFTTLIRFDLVYYGLFKCNRRAIASYPHLGPYLRDLYQQDGIPQTCDLATIKRDYYGSLFPLNPGGIIPQGPDLEAWLMLPHDRH
ncbi:MAG: glutathione S-transferase family protein [Synechococcaceae cyanobacterium RL_1_2]|nr:glutathione S-transferase family protein [Synechococcaceae cyanobacterium RL_1_2]